MVFNPFRGLSSLGNDNIVAISAKNGSASLPAFKTVSVYSFGTLN